jgi:flagella basal body P-ring formation protein FlgA
MLPRKPLKADNTAMKNFSSLLLAVLLLLALPAQAGAQQSHADIIEAITAFVRAQTHDLSGKIAFKVDEIDSHTVRPSCPALEVFLPSGSQLFGNSMVGVRCPGNKGWTLFVPVHVTVSVDMLITNKPLTQGHVLQAEDLSSQNGELAQIGILTDPSQAIGKVLKNGIGAGQVLKHDMLRAPYAVTQGQTVQLQVEGAGFSVRSEGQALNDAAEGQAVKVKTSSGQMVSGTARPGGIVEIRP